MCNYYASASIICAYMYVHIQKNTHLLNSKSCFFCFFLKAWWTNSGWVPVVTYVHIYMVLQWQTPCLIVIAKYTHDMQEWHTHTPIHKYIHTYNIRCCKKHENA